MRIVKNTFVFIIMTLLLSPLFVSAQRSELFTLTVENFKDNKPVNLNEIQWKYHFGDEKNWANPQMDDSAWGMIEGTTIKPNLLLQTDWNGQVWFRLRLYVDETLVNRNLALVTSQKGASEVYLNGKKLVSFGEITDEKASEYNPNGLPVPFVFERAGEQVIAVRFTSPTFSDLTTPTAKWLTNGKIYPGFSIAIKDAPDLNDTIRTYSTGTSMRGGFLFSGILFALALLHFLLYIFYRVERANLFYSIYAASIAVLLVCGNFRAYGHLAPLPTVLMSVTSMAMFAVMFVTLLAFLHVAFGRSLGKLFWSLTALWAIGLALNTIFLNSVSVLIMLTNITIGLSFTFSILLLTKALQEKRAGAWILFIGVQILALSMFGNLINQFNLFTLPSEFFFFAELALILSVPIAVSIFLARNFARTNRDLKMQLVHIEELSQKQIEQERVAAELRVENERKAKELEEARQLQLSMLPKKIPQISNLEIAAYMKPATEVGGDYYDFHIGDDGTLTVAVGDATGHGLKAGTVVTATKGLFNNLADAPDITDTFKQISRSLKAMNLRGLFMAMTMLKVKENRVALSCAGMPSVLIYRDGDKQVEEIAIKAMPLGSITNFPYRETQISLSTGDSIVLMSDGFPEMFNENGEMIADEAAKRVLSESAHLSAQEIINRFIEAGQKWAGTRPPDDDVTFVVMKMV